MIEIVKAISLKIATPEAVGSGIYLSKYHIIVTLEHIIRDYREVIAEGIEIPRQLAKVIYTDPMLDLAFLRLDKPLSVNQPDLLADSKEDQEISAFALSFTTGEISADGRIDIADFQYHGVPHVLHDALLDNSANGCGLFTADGHLLGINSFIHWKGRDVGMALPISHVIDAVEAYQTIDSNFVTRCPHCQKLVGGEQLDKCEHCGNFLQVSDALSTYKPEGVALTIEGLLSSMGYALELSRIGHNHWQLLRGSASINITYFEKNGLIIGDAYMCKLPDRSNVALFEYLLRKNHEMENLTFSVKEDDVILSLLIYDRYLNEQTGTELLTNLLEKADYFDNILVNDYQCLWRSSRKLT